MDRDDPNTRRPRESIEDESIYEPGHEQEDVPHEGGAEWHEPPQDDFADPEQAFAEEQVETNEGTEMHSYAGEGPAEEDFTEGSPATEEGVEEESSARAQAEQYLPKGMSSAASGWTKYIPYGGAVVVLLILGFLGFQQMQSLMGSRNNVTPPMPAPQEAENPASNPSATAENNKPPVPTPPALPAVPPPAPSAPEAQAQPGQAPPNSPEVTTTRGPDYILQPNTPPPAPASAPATAQNNALPLPPPPLPIAPPAAAPAPVPAASAPAVAPSSAANDALAQQLEALSQKLDDVKKNQDRLDEQLHTLQSNPPPAPTDDSVKTGLHNLEDKIAQLEQRFSAPAPTPAPMPKPSHKKTSVIAKPGAAQEEETSAATTTPAEEKPARHARHAKTARGKEGTDFMASHLQREMNARLGPGQAANGPIPPSGVMPPPEAMPPNGVPPSGPLPGMPPSYAGGPGPQENVPVWAQQDNGPPPPMPTSGGGWILRSAQPGAAWLSQGMSTDLVRAVPGDKVPGLGTIVSVRMVAGRWLVEGTQGSVR